MALNDANRAVLLEPMVSKAHVRKAMVLFEMDRYFQSLHSIRRALSIQENKNGNENQRCFLQQMEEFERKLLTCIQNNSEANDAHVE